MFRFKHIGWAFLLIGQTGLGQNKADSLFIRKIFDSALTQSRCYEDLRYLCKSIGPRLSGSPGAAQAVDFMETVMKRERFDTVFRQETMVPHWVRGSVCTVKELESGRNIKACALGGSEGGQAEAEVLEVQRLEQLDSLGEKAIKGKIVYFSRPMEPRHIHTFEAYGGCVDQRWAGPAKASKYGALATLVRSMNLREDGFPHTGSMTYDSLYPKIPALAISTEDATWLSRQMANRKKVVIRIEDNSRTLPDTLSHNVVGELRGTEKANEFIVVGGHLDAWDNGEGAHDDGAGCVHSIEALRILKNLGYTPRRSLRAVMFMNEENGLRGGKRYAFLADSLQEKHVYAIESDRGGFTPRGFYVDHNNPEEVGKVKRFKPLLEPYGLHDFKKGGGGADINPLKPQGTICIGFVPDSQRYFDHHHAEYDTFEHINKRELELGAASIAALIYLLDQYTP